MEELVILERRRKKRLSSEMSKEEAREILGLDQKHIIAKVMGRGGGGGGVISYTCWKSKILKVVH